MGAPMGAKLGTIGAFPLCFCAYGCSKWDVRRSGAHFKGKMLGKDLCKSGQIDTFAQEMCSASPLCSFFKCVRYECLESMYEHHPAYFLGLVAEGTFQHGGPFVPGDGEGEEL